MFTAAEICAKEKIGIFLSPSEKNFALLLSEIIATKFAFSKFKLLITSSNVSLFNKARTALTAEIFGRKLILQSVKSMIE